MLFRSGTLRKSAISALMAPFLLRYLIRNASSSSGFCAVMPYVIIITNPLKTRQRITIPIDTSRHFLHKIQNSKMAGTVLMQVRKGNLRIGWSYDSTRQQPATTNCIGVDTGISDCFHTSDGRAIGSMSPVIDFYHEEVEPAFAEQIGRAHV